jgi:hypothetical protein
MRYQVDFVTGQAITVTADNADDAHRIAQNEMPTTAAGLVTPMSDQATPTQRANAAWLEAYANGETTLATRPPVIINGVRVTYRRDHAVAEVIGCTCPCCDPDPTTYADLLYQAFNSDARPDGYVMDVTQF